MKRIIGGIISQSKGWGAGGGGLGIPRVQCLSPSGPYFLDSIIEDEDRCFIVYEDRYGALAPIQIIAYNGDEWIKGGEWMDGLMKIIAEFIRSKNTFSNQLVTDSFGK